MAQYEHNLYKQYISYRMMSFVVMVFMFLMFVFMFVIMFMFMFLVFMLQIRSGKIEKITEQEDVSAK